MNFLKPTEYTWMGFIGTIASIFFVVLVGEYYHWNTSFLEPLAFFILFFPAAVLSVFKLSTFTFVLVHTNPSIYDPELNSTGFIVDIIFWLLVAYLIGSLISNVKMKKISTNSLPL